MATLGSNVRMYGHTVITDDGGVPDTPDTTYDVEKPDHSVTTTVTVPNSGRIYGGPYFVEGGTLVEPPQGLGRVSNAARRTSGTVIPDPPTDITCDSEPPSPVVVFRFTPVHTGNLVYRSAGADYMFILSGALPSSLTFTDNGDGTADVHGTTAAADTTYSFTIRAGNLGGFVDKEFFISVEETG